MKFLSVSLGVVGGRKICPSQALRWGRDGWKVEAVAVKIMETKITLAFASRPDDTIFEVRLISTTTFETERSFRFREAAFHYDRGLLFAIQGDDKIRLVPDNCPKRTRRQYIGRVMEHQLEADQHQC